MSRFSKSKLLKAEVIEYKGTHRALEGLSRLQWLINAVSGNTGVPAGDYWVLVEIDKSYKIPITTIIIDKTIGRESIKFFAPPIEILREGALPAGNRWFLMKGDTPIMMKEEHFASKLTKGETLRLDWAINA